MFSVFDKKILYTTLALVFGGLFIFFSAALSDLHNASFFASIFFKQVLAILLGLGVMFFIAFSKKINAAILRKNSLYIFVFAAIFQLIVFVPGIGLSLKGAPRWVDVGLVTLQPSEFFKYAFTIFFSAVLVTLGRKIKKTKTFYISGLAAILLSVPIFLLIKDLGTLITLMFAILVMFLISRASKIHIFLVGAVAVPFAAILIYNFIPHVQTRLEPYIFSDRIDLSDNFYQINQMITSIGSGQISGRGFGASMQKFSGNLPEPLGDSIFAVYAEEWGFVGSVALVLAYLFLLYFILTAAKKEKGLYEKMLVATFGVLLVFPAFYNISAALGILPLSGMPITFVSKGGSSIFFSLMAVGVILNITRRGRRGR